MKIFLICVFVGIFAQLIDGTLGMAYGISCSTFLRTFGMSSAMSSACVHAAEIFTTLASGISHFSMKNVNKNLLVRLAVPGMLGGCLGAYILTSINDSIISPIISVYLIVMGFIIVAKMFKKDVTQEKELGDWIYPLAFSGGFSDSLGGGGWGPVVTSTLIAANHDVKKTIGSVNAAEFFVTLSESITFIIMLGSFREYFAAIGGLILGGVIAAPFAAYFCKKVPVRPLLGIVGIVIIVINTWKFIQAVFL